MTLPSLAVVVPPLAERVFPPSPLVPQLSVSLAPQLFPPSFVFGVPSRPAPHHLLHLAARQHSHLAPDVPVLAARQLHLAARQHSWTFVAHVLDFAARQLAARQHSHQTPVALVLAARQLHLAARQHSWTFVAHVLDFAARQLAARQLAARQHSQWTFVALVAFAARQHLHLDSARQRFHQNHPAVRQPSLVLSRSTPLRLGSKPFNVTSKSR